MKFIFIILLLISYNVFSQDISTSIVKSSIIEVVSASEDKILNFGTFYTINSGSIIITPYGERIVEGSFGFNNKRYTPGSFIIEGQDDVAFCLNLPIDPIFIFNDDRYLMITNWNSIPDKTILKNGMCIISVGATLNIDLNVNIITGIYSGSYPITFHYY